MLAFASIFTATALAARHSSDDDVGTWVKVGIFVIVLIVWAFSAMATAMKKAMQNPQRPVVPPAMPPVQRQAGAPSMMPVQPAAMPPAGYFVPAAAQRQPQRFASQQARPQIAKPQARRQKVPPPLPEAPVQLEEIRERPMPAKPPIRRAPAAVPTGMSAATLRKWLTPQVMRKQYVLTELFDPPPSIDQEPRTK